MKFNNKNELAFEFQTKKGCGVCYNGEIIGGEWKRVGYVQFNEKGELVFAFKTEKGCGVRYNGKEIFKEEWKDICIGEDYIEYRTKESEWIKLTYEDLKKRLDK